MTQWHITRRGALLAGATLASTAMLAGFAARPKRELTKVGSYEKKLVKVNGYNMAYVEAGEGDPIVFLHGNPTSSYLWRKILPYAEPYGRIIAPDLIGMGDSDKLKDSGPGSYNYFEHREFLDEFFDKVGIKEKVILVVHDWGSGLGLHWAHRHPEAIKGLVYMESLLIPPYRQEQVEERSAFFKRFMTPAGEMFVLEENGFVEKIMFATLGDVLTEEDKAAYRKPYLEPGESRRATLTWPQEVPFGGEPEHTWKIISDYTAWLPDTEFPKLFVRSEPGAIMRGAILDFCRSLKNQTEVTVQGGHYLQEQSPTEIGEAIGNWLAAMG